MHSSVHEEPVVQQNAIPMISYEDVGNAAAWLSEAFGFRETGERFTDPDGRIDPRGARARRRAHLAWLAG